MENKKVKLNRIIRYNIDLELYDCTYNKYSNGIFRDIIYNSYYLICFMIKGEGKFSVGENYYRIKENQGILIEPFTSVSYEMNTSSTFEYIMIEFGGINVKEYLLKINLSNDNPIFNYTKDNLLKDNLQNMAKVFSLSNNDIIRSSYLYEFMHLLFDNNKCTRNIKENYLEDIRKEHIEKALSYLEENIFNNITIKDVSEYININRTYLNRLFHEYMNKSPKQYLIELRIEKSCELLCTTKKEINDVGLEVGYDNPYIFSRIFKKYKGISPSEFRKKNSHILNSNVIDMEKSYEENNDTKNSENTDINKIEFFNFKRYNMDLDLYTCGHEKCNSNMFRGPLIRQHYLIHYVLKGKGKFKVNNKIYNISENQGFLIEPNVVTFYESDKEEPWEYIWIGFVGNKCTDYLKRANLSQNNPIFIYNKDSRLKECLVKTMQTISKPNNGILLISNLYEFLYILVENNNKSIINEDNIKDIQEKYIRRAIVFCENNYFKGITVQDIAEYINIGRDYLNKLFNLYLKKSPREFLLELRLNKACQLLLETNLDIHLISSEVGYNNQFIFSKIFKKYKGVCPSEYRYNVPRESFLQAIEEYK